MWELDRRRRTALAVHEGKHWVAGEAGTGDLAVHAAGLKGGVAQAHALQRQRIPQEEIPVT